MTFFSLGRIVINKQIAGFLLVNIIYVFSSFFYSVFFKGDHILDFLLVYKIFFYFFFISFLTGKYFLEKKDFSRFFKIILLIFFIKYLISLLVFNNTRPILFYENNFEIMFLSLLFYLYYILNGKVHFVYQFLLSSIFLISGSRSGLLILFFVLAIVNYRLIIKRIFFIIPIFLSLLFITIFILEQRTGGAPFEIESIDRFKFMLVFIDETKEWSFLKFLIGSDRISALSEGACIELGYYESLFSFKNNGDCYSVILHSYLLRVIYDHGVLGFIFIIGFIYKILRSSGYSYINIIVVLGIVMINGLSVSSFNSIYFILGLLFFIIIKNSKPKIN